MSKETPLSVAEREFILEALLENIRLDGRDTDAFRPLSVTFGEEYGHVKVQLGQTRWVTFLCSLRDRILIALSTVWLCAYPLK
jgi:exosome complex component RRP45